MPGEDGKTESFYRMLQDRVERWLASGEASEVPCAVLYRHLPDLFRLLSRLAVDPRVSERDRAAVMSTLKYVVAPFDLIPEAVVGTSGYRDDLVLAAFVVERLAVSLDRDVIRERWQAPGDPVEIARNVLDSSTAMVGSELCEKLRHWLPS